MSTTESTSTNFVNEALNDVFTFLRNSPPKQKPSPTLAESLAAKITELQRCVVTYGIANGNEEYKPESLPKNANSDIKKLYKQIIGNDGAGKMTVRGIIWKTVLLGPYILQRYQLGPEPTIFPQTDVANLGLFNKEADVDDNDTESPSFIANYSYTDSKQYTDLCKKGPCNRYKLIRDDSFRTFRKTDSDPSNNFQDIIGEDVLVRVLNAFDLKFSGDGFQYCQGINVFAGVFLYVMPELDAFNILGLFCTKYIPLYWRANHIGAEAGCYALDQVLERVDVDLYKRLINFQPPLNGMITSFAAVKTMSASATPLSEVLKLWDFLLCMGPHLSIVCVVAQILSRREQLMASEFPKEILDYRKWPKLDAKKTIRGALDILSKLDDDVTRTLALHPVSDSIVYQLTKRKTYNIKK